MKNRPYFFWDGRASSLQEQSLMPIQHPDEMGLSIDSAVSRLNRSPYYRDAFQKIFGKDPDAQNLSEALAAFEQTLETVDSRFDDWSNGEGRLTASEERGRQLFTGSKAKCFDCHFMEDFTDDEFRNIGLFNGKDLNDSGRYRITGKTEDIGKFKTPGLRNIAVTAPYMHDGRFKTLEEVISYYNNPDAIIPNSINRDTLLNKPLGLTDREKKDLIAFLKTLTDRRFIHPKAAKP
jgi:cytochrome c peroxidase